MQAETGNRRSLNARRILLFAGIAALVLVADLSTKALAFSRIPEGRPVPVIPGFFHLVISCNTGGVFGAFRGQVPALAVVSVLAIAFILWVFWKQGGHDLRLAVGLALLLGGAAGNLHDRVALSRVRDFLDFHLAGWHWPTFNLADAAITVGVGLLLMASLFTPAEAAQTEGGKHEDGAAKGGRPSGRRS
jgi:signal peptidase II